jgi:uncharacterized membrane protein YcaP (DUF421 family)
VSELTTTWPQVASIVLRTLIVYLFILAGFRLAGKREVGQLAPFDFALILLIANAVQNAMVGPDTSLVGGLVAAGVLLSVNFVLGRLASRSRRLERLLRGRARILVYRGKVDEEALRDEGLSHEDVLQAMREHGCPAITECRLVALEVDGTISVIGRPQGRPTPRSHRQVEQPVHEAGCADAASQVRPGIVPGGDASSRKKSSSFGPVFRRCENRLG